MTSETQVALGLKNEPKTIRDATYKTVPKAIPQADVAALQPKSAATGDRFLTTRCGKPWFRGSNAGRQTMERAFEKRFFRAPFLLMTPVEKQMTLCASRFVQSVRSQDLREISGQTTPDRA